MIIIKVPFSEAGLGKTVGTETAPDTIIEDLSEMHLNESSRKAAYETYDVDIKSSNISDNNASIAKRVGELSSGTNEKIIVLGGDHAMSYASFMGFAANNPGCGLVVLDAHPDLLPETGVQSHEDWIRLLINEERLDPKRLIIAGVRNTDASEKEFIDAKRIRAYSMKHIFRTGIQDFCDGITETVRSWPAFYLSVDIDAIDPAFAPGTGYLEPGGFSSRELIYIIQRLSMLPSFRIADIVEVNPKKDMNRMTSRLAAKIIKEIE
ncbi:arginase family protein [Candidatus Woesearchaeota archaeon]|nr:arginase family protein [Candidatus Woesearchaeota archaeon]